MQAIILLVFSGVLFLFLRRKKAVLYPPGPKGLPVLGNLFDFPKNQHWIKFTEWGQLFGDVVYLNVPGAPMVILNTAQAASDLMEKRSANYSDRPCMYFWFRTVQTPD